MQCLKENIFCGGRPLAVQKSSKFPKKALKKLLLGAVTFGVIEAISELGAAGQGIRGTRYERKDNIYLRQLRVMSFSHIVDCTSCKDKQ